MPTIHLQTFAYLTLITQNISTEQFSRYNPYFNVSSEVPQTLSYGSSEVLLV